MDYIRSIFITGRDVPFPSLFGAMKTAVTVDVLEVGWIVAFVVLALSFYIILPALGKKRGGIVFLRITVTLAIGLIIMLCNFGQEWEVGDVYAHMAYRAGTGEEIDGRLGVKLGLRSVNITLKAETPTTGVLRGEKINYNERFWWTWSQGRLGFGPFAGEIQREYRAAQFRGLPLPILWVAEYFTFDGEGIRFGRHYRLSGWYSHICVWAALPVWIVMVILFKSVVRYGAWAMALLGTLLLTAALIWAFNRNFIELVVPVGNSILKTHFGIHWYLSLCVGILCLVGGLIIIILDFFFNESLRSVFGTNPFGALEEEHEISVGQDEVQLAGGDVELNRMDGTQRPASSQRLIYRGRGTSTRFNKQLDFKDIPIKGSSRNQQDNFQQGFSGTACNKGYEKHEEEEENSQEVEPHPSPIQPLPRRYTPKSEEEDEEQPLYENFGVPMNKVTFQISHHN